MTHVVRLISVLWFITVCVPAHGADDWPPMTYLANDHRAATLVAHVDVRKAEVASRVGGYENWRLSAVVIEPLKGKLTKGAALDYYLGAEAGFGPERFLGEKIIFLVSQDDEAQETKVNMTLENSTLSYTEDRLKKLRSIMQTEHQP